MQITITINNEENFYKLAGNIGNEELLLRLNHLCNRYVDDVSANQAIPQKSLKEQITEVVKQTVSGSPADYYAAFKVMHPNSTTSYTTVGVYLREMVERGEVMKVSRGQYVCVI